MTKWSSDKCHKLRRKIVKFRIKIERVCSHIDEYNLNYFIIVSRQMNPLLICDDLLWKQSTKAYQYKYGNLNTQLYHNVETSNPDRYQCKSLLIALQKNPSLQRRVLHSLGSSISEGDNELLTTLFFIEEFNNTIFLCMQTNIFPFIIISRTPTIQKFQRRFFMARIWCISTKP